MCYFQLLFALFSFSLVLSVTNASEICNHQSALLTQVVLFLVGKVMGAVGVSWVFVVVILFLLCNSLNSLFSS